MHFSNLIVYLLMDYFCFSLGNNHFLVDELGKWLEVFTDLCGDDT